MRVSHSFTVNRRMKERAPLGQLMHAHAYKRESCESVLTEYALLIKWLKILYIIIPHVNSPYKTSIDERQIFYDITRCYSDGEYCHSFAITAGDIVKYQSFVWCATPMHVRFVHVRIRSTAMADMRQNFSHFHLPITPLFMVRNIKCEYSFS